MSGRSKTYEEKLRVAHEKAQEVENALWDAIETDREQSKEEVEGLKDMVGDIQRAVEDLEKG